MRVFILPITNMGLPALLPIGMRCMVSGDLYAADTA
jgi:hypothetical protein